MNQLDLTPERGWHWSERIATALEQPRPMVEMLHRSPGPPNTIQGLESDAPKPEKEEPRE